MRYSCLQGGISTITQAGGLTYVSGSQKAWAQRGTYTDSDQMLVLSGSPRVVDGGLTTTAQTIQFDRTTGDAVAEGNVKSTYSDLKAQPDGGMLASSDPIHVVSRSMTAHRSSAVAVYTGNARLWQNSNVVEAPTLEFDRDQRSLVADSSSSRPVKTVLVQVEKNGKVTPVVITSAHLTYNDADRKVLLDGGVTAKGSDATLTARQMTIFWSAQSDARRFGSCRAGYIELGGIDSGWVQPGERAGEKIIAEKDVVITEPARWTVFRGR